MRILGLDYGSARIGAALGDTESGVASPWEVIEVNGDADSALRRIQEMAEREGIAKIVVGVPRPLGDRERETAQTREARGFIKKLRERGLDVVEEDESLSTALASRLAHDAGAKGKRDDLAAVAILQSYLDALHQR